MCVCACVRVCVCVCVCACVCVLNIYDMQTIKLLITCFKQAWTYVFVHIFYEVELICLYKRNRLKHCYLKLIILFNINTINSILGHSEMVSCSPNINR